MATLYDYTLTVKLTHTVEYSKSLQLTQPVECAKSVALNFSKVASKTIDLPLFLSYGYETSVFIPIAVSETNCELDVRLTHQVEYEKTLKIPCSYAKDYEFSVLLTQQVYTSYETSVIMPIEIRQPEYNTGIRIITPKASDASSIILSEAAVITADISGTNRFDIVYYADMSLRAEKDQHYIEATFTVPTRSVFNALTKLTPVQISISGTVFNLLVDHKSKSVSGVSGRTYTIVARSPSCLLGDPNCDPLGYVLQETRNNLELITEFAAPIPVIFENVVSEEIPPLLFDVSEKTKIEAIRQLVDAVGCFVQSLPSGELYIRPFYRTNLSDLTEASAEVIFTSSENLAAHSEEISEKPNYREVLISNNSSETTTQITLEEVTDSSEARSFSSTAKELRAYEIPFTSQLVLQNASPGQISFYISKVTTESLEETVAILNGTGKLSKPAYALESKSYLRVDLGELTFTEDGSLSSEIIGTSLVTVKYTTKYYKYIIESSEREKVLIYVDAAV